MQKPLTHPTEDLDGKTKVLITQTEQKNKPLPKRIRLITFICFLGQKTNKQCF